MWTCIRQVANSYKTQASQNVFERSNLKGLPRDLAETLRFEVWIVTSRLCSIVLYVGFTAVSRFYSLYGYV